MNAPRDVRVAAAGPTPATVLRPELAAMHAYVVADARGLVKLDAMENPWPLPDDVREAVARAVAATPLNRYPDPTASRLHAPLKRALDLPDDCALLLGNGSDELIQLLTMAVARPGAAVLSIEPSFVMYRVCAQAAGVRHVAVPLGDGFALDEAAVLDAFEREHPALVWITYPNNPTGNAFDRAAIERLIERAPGLVVLDEAYHAFADDSFAHDLGRWPHLLVMRTLSKLGLAGVRLGVLAGPAAWIGELDKLRLPYNIDVLTQAVVEVVLSRADVLARQTARIRDERAALAATLAALDGVTVFPSAANFLCLRVARAARVFDAIKARGVLVKKLDGAHPQLADCLRVTVGTPDENLRFLGALTEAIEEVGRDA
jgi:histidinol-phosphate aminotransferase